MGRRASRNAASAHAGSRRIGRRIDAVLRRGRASLRSRPPPRRCRSGWARGDLFVYGIFTLIYILLGLGLNVVVGYAGLLDLGYVALFGFGAYFYALLSSPALRASLAGRGLDPGRRRRARRCSGSSSGSLAPPARRLPRDRHALLRPGVRRLRQRGEPDRPRQGLTGGPNGIADIDPLDLFGYELTTRTQQYCFLLGIVVVVLVGLHFLSESRTGRAWRALREDPLAAEAMSIPVNRLKLMAFAFGSGIAGLAGCIFAAVLTAVTPRELRPADPDHDLRDRDPRRDREPDRGRPRRDRDQRLLSVSRAREPADQRALLFYGGVVLLLVAGRPPAVAAGGRCSAACSCSASPRTRSPRSDRRRPGRPARSVEGGRLARRGRRLGDHPGGPRPLRERRVRDAHRRRARSLTRVHGWWRTLLLVPTVYLAAIVWENELRRAAGRRALDPLRRAARRPDDRAPAGPARHTAGGDRLMAEKQRRSSSSSGVTKSFGGLRVADRLDLHVDEGEIVSLIGPNGAGKTTVFNLVTGLYRPDCGRDPVRGPRPRRAPAAQDHPARDRAHLPDPAALPEHDRQGERDGGGLRPHAVDASSRRSSASRARGARSGRSPPSPRRSSRSSASGSPGYRHDQHAYNLSYANRRRLEIARAMATNPRLLLLDEPAAGMNPAETQELTELIGRLRDRGRLHGARDRARHACRRGHLRPRRRARPRREDRGRLVRRGRDRPAGDRGVPGTPGSGDEPAETARRRHVLRRDPHPPAALARGREGRARLPARRERLREVDDAEDDPRDRPAAARAPSSSTART